MAPMNNLAAALAMLDREEESLALFRRLVTLREARHGSQDVRFGWALHNLGSVLNDFGRHADAIDPLRRALNIFDAAGDSNPLNAGLTRADLAAALIGLGKPEDALRELEPIFRLPQEKLKLIEGVAQLQRGKALLALGHARAAEDVLARVVVLPPNNDVMTPQLRSEATIALNRARARLHHAGAP
jgi:tetratricopeptide (TPR) repeat protein